MSFFNKDRKARQAEHEQKRNAEIARLMGTDQYVVLVPNGTNKTDVTVGAGYIKHPREAVSWMFSFADACKQLAGQFQNLASQPDKIPAKESEKKKE